MYLLCTTVPAKRRKGRPVATEEEEAALDGGWTPRANTDLKITSIYNRSATEAPAEVTGSSSNLAESIETTMQVVH